ncbi:uncharacterized protein FIESC28_06086 [Fusarium coffeatum]|uniref:Ubiquitin-like protease family profile domain-containing protein n=1 Tax=Fusarium coffeatum TaxID=231269 RepID=A0A366RMF9_9HYPO|nr:uncharacterized protein FIESC28_06086 [Fusarium coffeatum]RBR18313.1 hypothetical protein FIESC28_06086 [Fusarium coffeatum]
MTNSRLRAINDQRPRGTMGTGLSTQTMSQNDKSRDERSSKRIKKSGPESSCAIAPRFVTNARLSSLEAIEDEEGASFKRKLSLMQHRFSREGSQADTVDGSSVTSNSRVPATSTSVQEYRNVQSGRRHGGRRSGRRRHGAHNTRSSPLEIDDDVSVVAHRNLPPQLSHAPMSPDCLSMSIDNGNDPPPADITSDIPPQSKRSAAEYAQSAAKRYKVHSTGSEDELSRPGTASGRETAEKSTISGRSALQPPPSRTQRGDIKPTNFEPATKITTDLQSSAMHGPNEEQLAVRAATSGKCVYATKSADACVNLRLDSDVARPSILSHQGQDLSWLEISKQSILRIKHSNSQSPIVALSRSVIGQAGGKVLLKFNTIKDASHFIHWLQGSRGLEQVTQDSLEAMFSKAMADAKAFAANSKDSSGPISPKITFTAQTPSRSLSRTSPRDPFKGEPISPRRPKLKDRMQGLPVPKEDAQMKSEDVEDPFVELNQRRRPETRQTRRSSLEPRRERSPVTWTAQNPGWDKDWHKTLVYPPIGRNRASVDKEDILRLNEGEFLNDNLISFYLCYLQVQLEKERPEILKRVYIFNTFFFEKLRSNRAKINYSGVKAWTARVDLLSYDYIVVPVNENAHWYLAIIYNAPRLLPIEAKAETPKTDVSPNTQEAIIVEDNDPAVSTAEDASVEQTPVSSLNLEASRSTRSQAVNGDGVVLLDDDTVTNAEAPTKTNKRKSTGGNQKYSTDEPRIITLDSLGASHAPTCKVLRDYLIEEAKDKKGLTITETPGGMTARGIPEQDNYCDCGVYVLGYMENFLRNPDDAVRRLLHKEPSGWVVKPQEIRAKVRDLLFEFQKEQHSRLGKEKELKRQRRASKGPVSSPQVAPSSPQVPQKDPETPRPKSNPKSGLENSTGRAPSEEGHKTGTTSAYFALAPPEKPVQPQTPIRNEDPTFVQPLREDSSNESKASSSGEVFHSARSSPVDTAQQVLPDLATEGHTPRSERRGPKQPSTPNFVQRLSQSSDEAGPVATSSTVKKNSSPSLSLATRQKTPLPAQRNRGGLGQPRVIKSIEDNKPSPKGPRYEGVERTIDLTG